MVKQSNILGVCFVISVLLSQGCAEYKTENHAVRKAKGHEVGEMEELRMQKPTSLDIDFKDLPEQVKKVTESLVILKKVSLTPGENLLKSVSLKDSSEVAFALGAIDNLDSKNYDSVDKVLLKRQIQLCTEGGVVTCNVSFKIDKSMGILMGGGQKVLTAFELVSDFVMEKMNSGRFERLEDFVEKRVNIPNMLMVNKSGKILNDPAKDSIAVASLEAVLGLGEDSLQQKVAPVELSLSKKYESAVSLSQQVNLDDDILYIIGVDRITSQVIVEKTKLVLDQQNNIGDELAEYTDDFLVYLSKNNQRLSGAVVVNSQGQVVALETGSRDVKSGLVRVLKLVR